jgi:hypothetical protein
MSVAQTILQQLGGGRFLTMTGSYNLIGSDSALTMKLRANKAGATHLRITLDPSDTYLVEFLKVRAGKVTSVKTTENIYFDQLQEIFTEVTGLYTHL